MARAKRQVSLSCMSSRVACLFHLPLHFIFGVEVVHRKQERIGMSFTLCETMRGSAGGGGSCHRDLPPRVITSFYNIPEDTALFRCECWKVIFCAPCGHLLAFLNKLINASIVPFVFLVLFRLQIIPSLSLLLLRTLRDDHNSLASA